MGTSNPDRWKRLTDEQLIGANYAVRCLHFSNKQVGGQRLREAIEETYLEIQDRGLLALPTDWTYDR